jgi:predicted Zn-dependent protease
MIKNAGIRIVAALLTVLASTTVFAQNPSSTARNSDIENIGNRDINRHDINFLSREEEADVGRSLAAKFETSVQIVDDPVVSDYIARVTQTIARNSDVKVPITVKVMRANEINAVCRWIRFPVDSVL